MKQRRQDYSSTLLDEIKREGKIRADGRYDFSGTVNLADLRLTKLPRNFFGRVEGDFTCYNNSLRSLEGAPEYVGRDFICSFNRLTHLKGAPEYVGRNYECYGNHLVSLEGAPRRTRGTFNCNENWLPNFIGAPEEVDADFCCTHNPLVSLEGAPKLIGGRLWCSIPFGEEDWRQVSDIRGKVMMTGWSW